MLWLPGKGESRSSTIEQSLGAIKASLLLPCAASLRSLDGSIKISLRMKEKVMARRQASSYRTGNQQEVFRGEVRDYGAQGMRSEGLWVQ